ncbi:hypothetical protein DY000_02062682 [Brassica cretica]|uniref:MATH domain-containing protein n=1 Tax=Brassica cretica TaxID=69181 RepID=A0ABQ7AVK0_BRACR|nr:hypothetical protein DY000_02062682 [Brassica cretica]
MNKFELGDVILRVLGDHQLQNASDELVLSLTVSVCQYVEKKEAEGSSNGSEVNSSNASKELVLAMLYLVGKYIEKKEAEGSSSSSSSEVNSGYESNEIVLKRILFSLLTYIKVKEVEGSSSINRGDASNELILPVLLSVCEYIKKKEAEGNSSNNQVNSGDASNELLLGMILSASENIETQEAEDILSQCEDIIKKDAEGSSSSYSYNEVNSCHASNKLVLAIFLRVFRYIKKKEAEGGSSEREVENIETETNITDVDAARPPDTEFTHKATGNAVTISEGTLSASLSFKACILLSPNLQHLALWGYNIVCRLRSKGVLISELKLPPYSSPWFWTWRDPPLLLTEHLFVFTGAMFKERRWVEVDSDIQFEFSCNEEHSKIVECGVQIMAEEGESSSREWKK